jgi:NADH-ubiquinone oxidoreductase chain 3
MLIFYLFFVSALVLALLALNLLLATKAPSTAKLSSYEAGYNTGAGGAPIKFSIPYFLVAILFMIFDLEILFIWPFAVALHYGSFFAYFVFIAFTLILTVGFVFELGVGVLDWAPKPDASTSFSSTKTPPKNSPPKPTDSFGKGKREFATSFFSSSYSFRRSFDLSLLPLLLSYVFVSLLSSFSFSLSLSLSCSACGRPTRWVRPQLFRLILIG